MGLRVLLLCTYFPPVNTTGARRPYYMARQLRDEGHTVTVVHTHREEAQPWNADVSGIRVHSMRGTSMPAGLTTVERLVAKLERALAGKPLHGFVRVLADIVLPLDHQHRWPHTAEELARMVGRHDMIIATGPTWSTFEFGHHLARQWNASYFPDHRDPWNVMMPEVALHIVTHRGGRLASALRGWRWLRDERRFTANATGITGATAPVLENALRVIGAKSSHVMLNGFEPEYRNTARVRREKFTMVYTGTVCREQEWDIVAQALEMIARTHRELLDGMEFIIAGARTDIDGGLVTLERMFRTMPIIRRVPRLGREAALELQGGADLLLHVGFRGKKGILPIKFIEYLNAGPPIIQVSTGHDIMEQVLEGTGTGFVAQTPDRLAALLVEHVMAWRSGDPIRLVPNEEMLRTMTWRARTAEWIRFLTKLHGQRQGKRPRPAGREGTG